MVYFMEEDKVKELAETLRKHGLAVSVYEAMEKAKSILSPGTSESKEEKEDTERFSEPDYEVTKEKASLNQLMQEIGVKEQEVKEEEKEGVGRIIGEIKQIREEISQSKSEPEKINKIRQELLQLNEEVTKILDELEYKKDE